ncbi:MAG: HAMP domain-containing protein, partial [Dehalococcoidia bacterium]
MPVRDTIGRWGGRINKGTPLSLRAKMLLSFGLLFAVVLLALKYVEFYGIPFTNFGGEVRQQEADVFKGLDLIADLKKERLMRWLEERRGDVRMLSQSPLVESHVAGLHAAVRDSEGSGLGGAELWAGVRRQRDYLELTRHLKVVQAAYGVYETIQIVDAATGTIIASTRDSDLGTTVSRQENFTGPLRSGDIHMDIAIDPHDGEASLFVSKSMKPADMVDGVPGGVKAVLILHVNTEDIITPMLHTGGGLGPTGEALLVDSDVRILTSLKHPLADGTEAQPLIYQIKAEPAVRAARGEEGIITSEDYRGEQVLAAYRHIPISPEVGWGMVVKRDESDVFAALRQSVTYSSSIGVIGFILVMWLTYIAASNIARPLRALSRTARRVEAGDLSARAAKTTSDEVGALAGTFNSMVARLQQGQQELEERVRDRTAELSSKNEELTAEAAVRLKAEQALRDSEEEYRKLFQTAPVMLYILDTDGVLLDCNQAFLETFGRSRKEMIGKPIYGFQTEESSKLAPAGLEELARDGALQGERDIITKSGGILTVEFSTHLEFDKERN